MSDMSSPPVGSTPPKKFIRVLGLRDLKPGEEDPALKPDPSEDCFGKKDDTGGDTSDRGHNMTELRRQRKGKAI